MIFMSWFTANLATILICVVLLTLFILAIRSIVKKNKDNGCGYCTGCSADTNKPNNTNCHCHRK